MEHNLDKFDLTFNNVKLKVHRHFIANQNVFHIVFDDKRIPLVITRALDEQKHFWWTSIPEGRQKEANEVGALVSSFLKLEQ